jgi:signal transduction histidine kinase
MKKSFRLHLFVRLFIGIAVVILANRVIAQQFLGENLKEKIKTSMAQVLVQCEPKSASEIEFTRCASDARTLAYASSLNNSLSVCTSKFPPSSISTKSLCEQLRLNPATRYTQWIAVDHLTDVSQKSINQEPWLIFRLHNNPEGPKVLVRQASIDTMVKNLWALRDQMLIYVFPTILLMGLLVALFLTYAALRPVSAIEKSLTQLSSKNLDTPLNLNSEFKEFESFVAVFEQLRNRLAQSFTQARRFAADASHELRTPLTILRGHSERLIADLPVGSDLQVRMRSIGEEIERLIAITEKLLLLSQVDANSIQLDRQKLSLSQLVEDIFTDAEMFHPSIVIHQEIQADVNFLGDASLISQLIHNLYSNAVKYNTAQGWIKLSLSTQGDRFTLKIENPCDNIPADFQAKAFDRFYRGDTARGRTVDGTGLGLSICKEIANIHQVSLQALVTDANTVLMTLEGKYLRA